MSKEISRSRSYRPDIDGLRAVAILSVVLYHAGAPWTPGGFTGVDVFFVISGYLIGGQILSELLAGSFSYLRFYQRRARRILPAFYAVLLVMIVASLLLLSPPEARLFGRSAFAATLSASNIVFWHNSKYFDTRSELVPCLMTWSLAVEEQFYVVVPILMTLLARLKRTWLLPAIVGGCALSLAIAELELRGLSQAAFQAAFYLLPARAWELGAGIVLAVLELRGTGSAASVSAPLKQIANLAGFALMLSPVFLLTAHSSFPGGGALPSVVGTAMVIATRDSWVNRYLLSSQPLVFIGRVSYSWYLWHWPLLAFLRILYGRSLPLETSLLAVSVAFVIAVLSYYMVEKPFRSAGGEPRRVLLRYATMSATLLVLCGMIWVTRGVPQRFPLLAQMESADPPLWFDHCLVDDDADRPNLASACIDRGDTKAAVAIWGDSHAAALSPGMRSIANAQGYGFVQLTKTTCLPLRGVVRYIPRLPEHAARCISFNQRVLDFLKSDSRVRIVVLTGEWSSCFERSWEGGWLSADRLAATQMPAVESIRALFIQSLQAQIRSLRAANKYVLVLEDVPNFDPDPLWRVRSARIPARNALAVDLGVDAKDSGFAANNFDASVDAMTEASLHKAVSNEQGVELADLKPRLCRDTDHCAYRDGDRLLYFDSGHLTAYGAHYAVKDFQLPRLHDLG